MWMLGPISIGAAGSAAMMLWSPFYWGLYLSMRPAMVKAGTRVAVPVSATRLMPADGNVEKACHGEATVRLAA